MKNLRFSKKKKKYVMKSEILGKKIFWDCSGIHRDYTECLHRVPNKYKILDVCIYTHWGKDG